MWIEISKAEWEALGGEANKLLARIWAYRGTPEWTYFRPFD